MRYVTPRAAKQGSGKRFRVLTSSRAAYTLLNYRDLSLSLETAEERLR